MKTKFIIKTNPIVQPVAQLVTKTTKKSDKNYKVLAFQNQSSENIYTLQDDDRYHGLSGCTIPYESCIDRYRIYSVIRLSDGTIFTVGDEVSVSNNNDTIKHFGHNYSDFYKQDIAVASFKILCTTNIRDLEPKTLKSIAATVPTKKKVNALFIGKQYM